MPSPQEGAKYENGVFESKHGPVIVTSLTIHGDGFVIDTRSSTDDADDFAIDALSWIAKEHDLPDPNKLPFTKIYASELNVIFGKPPQLFDAKFAPFFKSLSSAISDEKTGKAEFIGFNFGTDPSAYPRQQLFKIDREISTPYEQNRYYSFAPTKTEVHLKLLEKLDELL